MIPAPGIEDQELPVRTKWASIDDPSVAWRGHLRGGASGDRQPLFGAPQAIGCPEFANLDAAHGERERALGGGERDGRRQASRILEGGETGAHAAFLGACGGIPCASQLLLELDDEILEAVGVARELGSALALRLQRLFRFNLFLLTLLDQERHAPAVLPERRKIA